MYIIIAGSGRLGTELAVRYSDKGHDVVIIDADSDKFEEIGKGFNGMYVSGMPFDEDILQEAGIINADVVAAVTDDDNVNVMISQIAKVLYHIKHVLTRISAPDKVHTFRKMGFDVICPAIIAADSAESMLMMNKENRT